MRLLLFMLVFALSPLALPIAPAMADTIVIRKTSTDKLDKLFSALRKSKSEAIAGDIADEIRDAWNDSGSANVDLMMKWADAAMNNGEHQAAMDWLDKVVAIKPDYSEGWNRRATLHFLMNNFSKSMSDIERTLVLEPRHFGALSGMGMIFLTLDNKRMALAAYRKALEIYPMMRDAQKTVGELEDEIAGSAI